MFNKQSLIWIAFIIIAMLGGFFFGSPVLNSNAQEINQENNPSQNMYLLRLINKQLEMTGAQKGQIEVYISTPPKDEYSAGEKEMLLLLFREYLEDRLTYERFKSKK